MPEAPKRPKLDIPFHSDQEIAGLVEQFELCEWPYVRWTHRAHFAVAVHYLSRFSLSEAIERIRHHIQLYNRTVGDGNGYHETITVLFMRRIAHQLRKYKGSTAEVVDELCRSHDVQWPLTHYSPERLWSNEAKVSWVEPDLLPLDF